MNSIQSNPFQEVKQTIRSPKALEDTDEKVSEQKKILFPLWQHKLNCLKEIGWLPKHPLQWDIAELSRLKNLAKSIQEHTPQTAAPLLKHLATFLEKDPKLPNFSFKVSFREDLGLRKVMQDRLFFKEFEGQLLAGVFDGNGDGGEVLAQIASTTFQENFFNMLKEEPNVTNIFQKLVILSEERARKVFEEKGGVWVEPGSSCASIVFIDKAGWIHTATLGDCEAKLYRSIEKKLTSIPLSVMRNWHCKKEKERAYLALKSEGVAEEILNKWFSKFDPRLVMHREAYERIMKMKKKLKVVPYEESFKKFYFGTNVSRGIGRINFDCYGKEKLPGQINKVKVTSIKARSGDKILIASDGLWNDYKENSIILLLEKHRKRKDFLSALQKNPFDNRAVIYIKLKNLSGSQ